jgi:adenine-specific DNA-methyltransferase
MKSCMIEIKELDKTHQAIRETSKRSERSRKGQFLTPTEIAKFMAGLFEQDFENIRILDAGAGAGVLFTSSIETFIAEKHHPKKINVVAYENDLTLLPYLQKSIFHCKTICEKANVDFNCEVRNEDFIREGINFIEKNLFEENEELFTHAILNPPYKKINGQSATRRLLNEAEINVSNFYAAFVWLTAKMLKKGGELVFITPRSFCNGPYFRTFRKALLNMTSIKQIHIFNSRNKAFGNDNVLQENVIFHAIRGIHKPTEVIISSTDSLDFQTINIKHVPYENVVKPDDTDAYIHLVINDSDEDILQKMKCFNSSLCDLGLEVSTGRVVDFRASQYLQQQPDDDSIPLIYPCHFKEGFITWPVESNKKPNAIKSAEQIHDLLIPSGYYVLTKRFSAKEEHKRVVAAIYDPKRINNTFVAFENHLNYFHMKGRGMTVQLAKGLSLYLNSSLFDRYFRLFSGHTQVNAADLRKMHYPAREQLIQLGSYVNNRIPNQEEIDIILDKVCKYNYEKNTSK